MLEDFISSQIFVTEKSFLDNFVKNEKESLGGIFVQIINKHCYEKTLFLPADYLCDHPLEKVSKFSLASLTRHPALSSILCHRLVVIFAIQGVHKVSLQFKKIIKK